MKSDTKTAIRAADVAKAVGTSVAAVSRAFRPQSPISNDLREKIILAARDLGYISPQTKVLSQLSSGSITLVAGDLSNPFYPVAVSEFSKAIHGRNHRMILHAVPPGGSVDTVMNQVLELRSNAAIVMSALMSSMLTSACRKQNMPVVLFNRIQPDNRMTAVTCDNYGGGRLVAERFLSQGRKRISMIGGRVDTSTHLERARGFQDRLQDAGVQVFSSANGEFDYATSYRVAKALLTPRHRPDALFCINDIMAMAALDAARELGLRCPDDLAIIGFDDIPMASWPSYRLTSIRQPLESMVNYAMELVDEMIADPSRAGAIRIAPVTLIERASG